jgi:hypothetical protein
VWRAALNVQCKSTIGPVPTVVGWIYGEHVLLPTQLLDLERLHHPYLSFDKEQFTRMSVSGCFEWVRIL